MSSKSDPMFVKFVVRQVRAIYEGGIPRDAETPRWEREGELCSAKYPWLAETLLEAFSVGIRRAYWSEHATKGFEYQHLPNLLEVEKRAAQQLSMLQLVNKEEDAEDGDLLSMSIQDIVVHMAEWVSDDPDIKQWEKEELLSSGCIVPNACDHLIDVLINLRLSIDETYSALEKMESMADQPKEHAASESGQIGAV